VHRIALYRPTVSSRLISQRCVTLTANEIASRSLRANRISAQLSAISRTRTSEIRSVEATTRTSRVAAVTTFIFRRGYG